MTRRPSRFLRRLIGLFTWGASDRDMDQEMAFHVESMTREFVRSGMSEAEAEREARRRFGSVLRLKEQGHDILSARLIEDVVRDVRHMGRGLRRSPGFAIAVVLTRESLPTIQKFGLDFWRTEVWDPIGGQFGALPFIWGTLYSSILALAIATPIALGIAVFISELCPALFKQPLVFLTELLAA